MSSPIATRTKGPVRNAFIKLHQKISHSRRVDLLSKKISSYIDNQFLDAGKIKCLDVGCGDMSIEENISRFNPKIVWNCIDIYDLPENLTGNRQWINYQKFDGVHIPFDDRSMDIVLLCDVLHHAREEAENLLRESARVGKVVIIKDHFEYSLYSRTMLKFMDFIGNWGYGVILPDKYLTKESFEYMYQKAGLRVKTIDIGIDLYSHLPVVRNILKPKWQFISVLESLNQNELYDTNG
jgi:ubiquinone/menaquinone biosynthesis C-methylase UbiE